MAFSVTDSKYPGLPDAKNAYRKEFQGRLRDAIARETHLHVRGTGLARRRVKRHVFLISAFYAAGPISKTESTPKEWTHESSSHAR
jgi:hypothetical protein